jgi:hypothetical protein
MFLSSYTQFLQMRSSSAFSYFSPWNIFHFRVERYSRIFTYHITWLGRLYICGISYYHCQHADHYVPLPFKLWFDSWTIERSAYVISYDGSTPIFFVRWTVFYVMALRRLYAIDPALHIAPAQELCFPTILWHSNCFCLCNYGEPVLAKCFFFMKEGPRLSNMKYEVH